MSDKELGLITERFATEVLTHVYTTQLTSQYLVKIERKQVCSQPLGGEWSDRWTEISILDEEEKPYSGPFDIGEWRALNDFVEHAIELATRRAPCDSSRSLNLRRHHVS